MPNFYNKADLIVFPSVTEGFPGIILEAYACAKPVLAAREAFPEELKVFGSVVDIEDFEFKFFNELLGTFRSPSVVHSGREHMEQSFLCISEVMLSCCKEEFAR